jgi:hypothetical protein
VWCGRNDTGHQKIAFLRKRALPSRQRLRRVFRTEKGREKRVLSINFYVLRLERSIEGERPKNDPENKNGGTCDFSKKKITRAAVFCLA